MYNYIFIHALEQNQPKIEIPANNYHEAIQNLKEKGNEISNVYYLETIQTDFIPTFAHCPLYCPIPQQHPLNN